MSTSATKPLRARLAAAALACLPTFGCAVGPDFHRPAPPRSEAYAALPRTALSGDEATQTIRPGAAVDPAWWRMFGSGALNDLVTAGLKASPTLASARSALAQSEFQARAGAGVFFPSADVAARGMRERTTPALTGGVGVPATFSLYTLTGSVGYAIDLFGGERRNVEALGAQADQQRYALGAAYLLLTSNIVDTAIARAGYAEEADVMAEIVRLDEAQRDVLDAQYKAGVVSWSAELAAEQQLAADRESLADVSRQLAAAGTLLRTLLGREAGEALPQTPRLQEIAVPADAPVSLPSQLVRRRPDVLQAEAALHEASAEVGVATAALFPSISLTGDYGAASSALSRLSGPVGRFWSIGPSIDVPIFHGGALWFGRKAAQAAYAKAQAQYRQTVLSALEQVSDQLKSLDADAEIAGASRTAADAGALNQKLSETNLSAGVASGADAMAQQIGADRARLTLIAARSQRLQDVVGLYVACGGGWDASK